MLNLTSDIDISLENNRAFRTSAKCISSQVNCSRKALRPVRPAADGVARHRHLDLPGVDYDLVVNFNLADVNSVF